MEPRNEYIEALKHDITNGRVNSMYDLHKHRYYEIARELLRLAIDRGDLDNVRRLLKIKKFCKVEIFMRKLALAKKLVTINNHHWMHPMIKNMDSTIEGAKGESGNGSISLTYMYLTI